MAKIVIKDNHVYFRHWFKWYVVRGRVAQRMIFNNPTDKT